MSGPVPPPVTYPVTYTHRGSLSIVAASNTALGGDGSLTIAGTLATTGNQTISGNLGVTGTLAVTSTSTFTGATTHTGAVTFNGGIKEALTTVTATGTIALGVSLVKANCGGVATLTIPSAVTAGAGYKVTIMSVGAGAVTVAAAAGNINGAGTHALGAQYNSATYVSDGTNYFISAIA